MDQYSVFYTPQKLADAIGSFWASSIFPTIHDHTSGFSRPINLLDTGSGGGAFGKALKNSSNGLDYNLYGVDIRSEAESIIDPLGLGYKETFLSGYLSLKLNQKMDSIIGNPPFLDDAPLQFIEKAFREDLTYGGAVSFFLRYAVLWGNKRIKTLFSDLKLKVLNYTTISPRPSFVLGKTESRTEYCLVTLVRNSDYSPMGGFPTLNHINWKTGLILRL